jgi:lipopolysaccharide export system permease protein
MKTIRRLIHRETISSVLFVGLGFLLLFMFFDTVDEMQSIGKGVGAAKYQITHALIYVLLRAPNHMYEVLPISVLIGTIMVMARFAQSSEYTILRTSGLGPWRSLKNLLILGLGFTVLTFAIGDYVAPKADHFAQILRSRFLGEMTLGSTGAWLKEKQRYSNFSVNVAALDANSGMRGIRIFEFDSAGRVMSTTQAESGVFGVDDAWLLSKATRSEFGNPAEAAGAGAGAGVNSSANSKPSITSKIERISLETFRWPTEISYEMVSVALLKPERMATVDLWQYIRHLDANGQSAQRYEIEFWRKVFYPLSCLVMMVLALPFAYLHFRSGAVSTYVFIGVMVGISFFLLNNVFGFIGNLNNWEPWLAAAIPGLLYSAGALGAFGWLVLRR